MALIKTIDLFAGCGGLTEGFSQTGLYNTCAFVEWESAQCENLRKRLKEKYKMADADERVIRFDIQRTNELLNGFDDPNYGKSAGLKHYAPNGVDLIIGGPPCQAYSVAGRIRDENGMKDDYRNYLFESYLEVVKEFRPKVFVFENVPGILSAKPGDKPIVDLIHEQFSKAEYAIIQDLRQAVVDVSEYGVPQKRRRVIILGLNLDYYKNADSLLDTFYKKTLPAFKENRIHTLREAIGDLPPLFPTGEVCTVDGVRTAHSINNTEIKNHICRYHNERDIQIFKLLTEDIEKGINKYKSVEARIELYTEITGRVSNIHKYSVLNWNEPSTTIPAHLCKDGLRHIHPDSKQARTITVREAARIQTFPDDYEFIGAMTDQYKMIGNAVPPEFSRRLALAINDLLFKSK